MAIDVSTHEPSASTRSRPGRLLGDVLVELGFCDRATVESIVRDARAVNRPMQHLLLERGIVDPGQLALAVAERFGLEYMSLDKLHPDIAAMQLVPESTLRRLQAVPVGFRDQETLIVAMANPTNVLALDDLTMLTDLRVEPIVVSREDLELLLQRLGRLEKEFVQADEAEAETLAPTPELEASVDDGPTAKLVRSLVSQAIDLGASDVHFDPDEGDLQVRYRIDGIMAPAARIPRRQAARVISRIKILSDLDISERRMPQDGRTSLTLEGRRVDVRVTIVPLVDGESAVMRILDPGDGPLSLGELGMGAVDRARVDRALRRSHGAILATGPTGSGKSTSLYASVAVVSSPEKTVMTIEDPVEYRLPGVKQMQVFERAGLTFQTGLRAIVRADPDIIMVGEMRDRESARIAIEAALTGHLVLSTLHTNSAPATPARLIEMGVEPYLVASAVDCILAQRLARRLCTSCRLPVHVAGSLVGLPDVEEVEIYEPGGCHRCRETGYRGRLGLFEVMIVTDEIRALIVARAPAVKLAKLAVAQGMTTLTEDGLEKVRTGQTTLAEISRVMG
ncbi:MAG TPA: ATPase, T2SS/T4P/T4SS family [Solirubrobacteraceae bacterium]|jgi:type IV pilus assembly protein PilB|nr:ATPase, T2SS/T4P/T4SS family [Solirubrobacteraceae bacterium]